MSSKTGDTGVTVGGRGAKPGKTGRALFVVEGNGLRFGLAERDGSIVRSGRFPGDAPAGENIVVADYALLSRPELFRLSADRAVELLPPRSQVSGAGSGSEQHGFIALARAWSSIPVQNRARLAESEMTEIDPLLSLRREQVRQGQRAIDESVRHLVKTYPGYASVLVHQGVLPPESLAVLRVYPTPAQLRAEDGVRLRGVLEGIFDRAKRPLIDEILAYRKRTDEAVLMPAARAHSTQLILGAIDVADAHRKSVHEIDREIRRLAGPVSAAPDASARPELPDTASVLDFQSRGGTIAQVTAEPLPELVGKVRALRERSASEERDPKLDLGVFLQLRTAIETSAATLGTSGAFTPSLALELAVLGQRLALAAMDFPEAAHSLAVTQRLLEDAAASDLDECECFEAEFVAAITGLVTTNVPTGFGRLRELLQDPRSAKADPALVAEMLGLVMLTLSLYGETVEHEVFFAQARTQIDELGAGGAARAARDISELLLTGADPDTTPETLADLIERSGRNSRGTYLRPFHNLIMMSVCYATRDRDAAANNYAELQRSGVWERHSPSLHAQAELSHAFHLAGSGDLAAARRQLAGLRAPTEAEGAGTFPTQRELFALYLRDAVGDTAAILQATEPDGPLGEQRLARSRATRYLPASLVLRGSALVRDGAREMGESLFRQATLVAAQVNAWIVLLCGETPEYRRWLEELPEEDLPEGLSVAGRARILSRPLFFERRLPSLTGQQERVLRLIALGNSSAAIAADLHITANTLKTHVRRLYARLGVNTRKEAVRIAEVYGLVE